MEREQKEKRLSKMETHTSGFTKIIRFMEKVNLRGSVVQYMKDNF